MIQLAEQLLYFSIFAFLITFFFGYQQRHLRMKKRAVTVKLGCKYNDFRLVREKESGQWLVFHYDKVYSVYFSETDEKVVYMREVK